MPLLLFRTEITGPNLIHALIIRDKKMFLMPSTTYILQKKGLPASKITDNFRNVSKTLIFPEDCEVSSSTLNHLLL